MRVGGTFIGLVLAASLAMGAGRAGAGSAASSAQALRTCVDRWNQANMIHWGPAPAGIAVRRPTAADLVDLGGPRGRRRCVVALALEFPRDPRQGCYGGARVPGHPRLCVDRRTTHVCVATATGAYRCATRSDGAPPLRNENAATDEHGVLALDRPLTGTHATPLLAWQRYPHVDGFVQPWTRAGKLRAGLRLSGRHRGACVHVQEWTLLRSALRCLEPQDYIEPCFPPQAHWNRRGVVVACGTPGGTTFLRFVIVR